MITFLTSPKAFTGPAGTLQMNAIRSWQHVHPDAEVMIFGDSAGAVEACAELGVQHIPAVPSSPSGVPYFNGIAEYATLHARHDIQVYLNCDILINKAIAEVAGKIGLPGFLITGQRIDLAEGVQINMASDSWKEDLRLLAKEKKAVLHAPTAMDYFVFPRGLWYGLPPLVVGRGGYDGALVAFCLRREIPLIDGTYAIPALHQYHDYGHVSGAMEEVFQGEDARRNMTIHRIKHSIPNSADAEWQILKGSLNRSSCRGDWIRRVELTVRFVKGWEIIGLGLRLLWRLLVMVGLHKQQELNILQLLDSYELKAEYVKP